MVEANINAEAQPAASAIRTIVIISCPAPFERLEAFAPTIGDRTIRKPYEKQDPRRGLAFIVIPGRREAANPESSHVQNCWIPGSLALRAPRNDS
jgi:hypothetical protein